MSLKRLSIALLAILLLATTVGAQGIQINVGGKGRKDEEKTKNVHGAVLDQTGKPIAGARVIVVNSKDKTSRTVTTDEGGNYALRGLAPDVNHEIRADYKGAVSDLKTISSMLDREDNLVNFQLPIAVAAATVANADPGPELQAFDLVKLKASYELPQGVPAPIPAVLFLHGYGENRAVWNDLRKQFLERGWAVMSLDLRGHGLSDKPRDGYDDSKLWADDVNAVIQSLSLDDPLLCGWSYGSLVILDYIRHYTEEVSNEVRFVNCQKIFHQLCSPESLKL